MEEWEGDKKWKNKKVRLSQRLKMRNFFSRQRRKSTPAIYLMEEQGRSSSNVVESINRLAIGKKIIASLSLSINLSVYLLHIRDITLLLPPPTHTYSLFSSINLSMYLSTSLYLFYLFYLWFVSKLYFQGPWIRLLVNCLRTRLDRDTRYIYLLIALNDTTID